MAIYHFTAKIISRASGRSSVAAAAYRSASRIHDDRQDVDHDYSRKEGVVHSEVLLPDGAPSRLGDRAVLWNMVEGVERRKDAQLAREVEVALPREMTIAQGVDLARSFVAEQFVSRGMIADLNVHWDIGDDDLAKPHAHVMLTLREVGEEGFGKKVRAWNAADLIEHWREAWGAHVNERLAELDIAARIDHRSLAEQGIDLEPQGKVAQAATHLDRRGEPAFQMDALREIRERNGERIAADPTLALDALTRHQATFSRRDVALFVHRHSNGQAQYDRVLAAVHASPELVLLGKDAPGEERFSTRDMIEVERRMLGAADQLAGRHDAPAPEKGGSRAGAYGFLLGDDQEAALDHVISGARLSLVLGVAGSGKSTMLRVAREVWKERGLTVRGLALSGIAAQNLEAGSGIASRTIASLEQGWSQGRDLLSPRDVLVIDEAAMVGTRQLERLLSEGRNAGAKIVLVGDPQQLQAIEAGAAMRALVERHGAIEIGEVRRQREPWQREATRALAAGRVGEGVHAYDSAHAVHAAGSREDARDALIREWDRNRVTAPEASRIILTHTNDEVRALNDLARGAVRMSGGLEADVEVETVRGRRAFAAGDRLLFLRNERGLDVRNGTLGLIENVDARRIAVRLDDGRPVAFDLKHYADIDHGYAMTVHKAQGSTVDHAHVLATPGLDAHASYVALSRHRESVSLHYGRDDFADVGRLVRVLSRDRAKDNVGDHIAIDPVRDFAERRGLTIVEQVREAVAQVRSIFASFRPKERRPDLEPLPPAWETERADARTDERRAVERFARAWGDVARMRDADLSPLPHQTRALEQARQMLDRIRPDGSDDLGSAFEREPGLVHDASHGRVHAAMQAMAHEARVRTVPFERAERFVAGWQELDRDRQQLMRDGDLRGVRLIEERMAKAARAMERDREVASLLLGGLSLKRIDMDEVGKFSAPQRTPEPERERSRGFDR